MTLQKVVQILSDAAYNHCVILDDEFYHACGVGAEAVKGLAKLEEYLCQDQPKKDP